MSERQRKVRIGRLDTLGGVLKEMGRVYRQTRRGDIDDQHGARLVGMLRAMRETIEVADIERRLEALEGESPDNVVNFANKRRS